jgi:hypothetical protein
VEELLFVNKKKQKNFTPQGLEIWPGHSHTHGAGGAKVFWFFFSKKNRLSPTFVLI